MKIFEQNATKVVNLEQLERILNSMIRIYEGNTRDQIHSIKGVLNGLSIESVKPPLTLGDFKRIGRSISNGCSANPQIQNIIMGYYMDNVTICTSR